jgi:CubicO group peptidase (beta-lactamase class C family)
MRALPLLLLLAVVPLSAQSVVRADPASVGADPARLARIGTMLDSVVARGQMAGAVALVMRDGVVVYERAVGMADREARRAMTPGTRFRIASQTKAITSVAVMTLVEEGRVNLSDPVSRWIPNFGSVGVLLAPVKAGDTPTTATLKRAPTLRDLLTHAAGLSYGTEAHVRDAYAAAGLGPNAGYGWYLADKTVPVCTVMDRLATLPLVAQPGERFVYGYGTDVLGCIVERASGVPFDRFLEARIFTPLAMEDTGFCVAAHEADRLAAVYAARDGALVRADTGARGEGHYVAGTSPCTTFAGGAGLVSTAHDYARFLEMLRQGGALDGARILAPATVALMTRDHLGTMYGGPEVGFGLGFEVWEAPAMAARPGEPGQYGWGGAYATTYWVDPASRLVGVLMTQLLPGIDWQLHEKYRMAVYQALR